MAFQQQPTRPSTAHRIVPPALALGDQTTAVVGATAVSSPSSNLRHVVHDRADEHTWILFSPTGDDNASYLTETDGQSLLTPGRSRFSELGSIGAGVATLDYEYVAAQPAVIDGGDDRNDQGEEDEENIELDDAELDSLDSHLAEFRAHPTLSAPRNQRLDPRSPQPDAVSTVQLPSHDGLGIFRIQQPGSGRAVQEQIFAFERRRQQQQTEQRARRRESQAQREREAEEEQVREAEKMQRIEAWRLEQSRILLDEIQKLTRRRRRSEAERRRLRDEETHLGFGDEATTAAAGDLSAGKAYGEGEWHDEDTVGLRPASSEETESEREEGFWTRITKRVIRELMGIDDRLLSILFGETAPDEEDLSTTGAGPVASAVVSESSWQLHILERVARELGMLVNQLSHHPGAFSTYVRVQQMPLPYAGLPIISEARSVSIGRQTDSRDSSSPYIKFKATVPPRPRTPPMQSRPSGRAHRSAASQTSSAALSSTGTGAHTVFTQEEWEQDLDIGLVFRYLRSRFTSRSPYVTGVAGTAPGTTTGTTASVSTVGMSQSHLAIANTQDAAAKSARVRQHHPLVGISARGRQGRVSKTGGGVATGLSAVGTTPTAHSSAMITAAGAGSSAVVGARRAPSCTSRSTRRSSARRSSCSSKNYWDIGRSIGAGKTGSVIASVGPMGSWGEV